LEYAVGFFDRVYRQYGSEAIVLVLWDLKRQRYRLWVPRQYPSVWVSSGGYRTPMDVHYEVPTSLPPHHLLAADIHSHADMAAYSSHTDKHDETYRDGVHVVIGRIEEEPPEFHLELAIDGYRFGLRFDDFLEGYGGRRRIVPRRWLDQLKVTVEGPKWSSWSSQVDTTYGTAGHDQSGSYHNDSNHDDSRDDDPEEDSIDGSSEDRQT
jgi:hypothetical protein